MAVEAGPRPRIVVLDGKDSVVLERALSCQSTNHHMESRMTRSLANGRFVVPQLLDKVVREYGPDGKVTWEYRTPETPPECWPFTAIRTSNGRTLVTLTHGNRVVEVDRKGQVTWSLDNTDLHGPWLKDPCGAQRLANGNVVITSYGAGDQKVKLFEVNRRKRVAWTHEETRPGGIHHFQVRTTNGRKEPWPALSWALAAACRQERTPTPITRGRVLAPLQSADPDARGSGGSASLNPRLEPQDSWPHGRELAPTAQGRGAGRCPDRRPRRPPRDGTRRTCGF